MFTLILGIKTVIINNPIIESYYAPNLSNNLPAIGIIIPITRAPGNKVSPNSVKLTCSLFIIIQKSEQSYQNLPRYGFN